MHFGPHAGNQLNAQPAIAAEAPNLESIPSNSVASRNSSQSWIDECGNFRDLTWTCRYPTNEKMSVIPFRV
jgi:hypothetical protein